jgi:hypothetical protein
MMGCGKMIATTTTLAKIKTKKKREKEKGGREGKPTTGRLQPNDSII